MANAISLQITGTLDPDGTLFALCMERAAQFPAATFTEYASRVESLVEIAENVSVQRMMPECEEVGGA